jgi:hypothetical protein
MEEFPRDRQVSESAIPRHDLCGCFENYTAANSYVIMIWWLLKARSRGVQLLSIGLPYCTTRCGRKAGKYIASVLGTE